MLDDIQVGDIVVFDTDNPANRDVRAEYLRVGPMVVVEDLGHSWLVEPLRGTFPEDSSYFSYFGVYGHNRLPWFRSRFRKDVFLTEAKRANHGH